MAWQLITQFNAIELEFNNDTRFKYRVVNEDTKTITFSLNNSYTDLPAKSVYELASANGLKAGSNIIKTNGTIYYLTLQRELINTAPTQPGAFTQPNSELEIGDTRTISWGASTDAEENFSNYVLERSIDGGSWQNVNNNLLTNTHSWPIPTATTLKFRVKAQDSAGLQSAYRESPIYTVTKPKYYWSKYNVAKGPGYGELSDYITPMQLANLYGWYPTFDIYRDWKYNPTTNKLNGVDRWVTGVNAEELFSVPNLYTDSFAIRTDLSNSADYIYKLKNGVTGSLATANASRNANPVNIRLGADIKGSLIQSGLIAEEGSYPTDGKHTDGYWYVRGSRVNQSIAPTGAFSAPATGTKFKPNQTFNVTFTATTAANLSLYEVDYRYKNGVWTTLGNTNALSRTFTITTDKTLTDVQFRVRAKNTSNVYSDYVYSEIFQIEHNVAPLLTLNTENNRTLYENDTFIIEGSAIDNDDNQTLTIYYQIDSLPAKVIAPGLSKTTIPFNKQLVFKGSKLFEGETAITEALADGQAHTLKVWATDNENSSSVIAERSFHVVPNRAPVLAVNPINQASGMINSDEMTISGTASDPDGNSFVVSYKINGGLNTEIYRGKDSEWSFQLNLKSLKDGENKIVIEVVDTYNSKFSKTITLNKSFITTPIQKSTAFYEITLPKGSASGVLLWIQRENGLGLTAEISMTLAGEQEKFVPMTLETSEMLTDYIMEDEFIYEATAAKDKAILKLNLSRESLDTSFGVTLLSGVLS